MNERGELLAAVRARLQRVAAGPDLSPVLEPEAITEARQLAGVLVGDEGDLEVRHLLGWLSWYRFQASTDDENRPALPVVTGLFLPCFLTGAGELPAPLLPVLADQATAAAEVWLGPLLGSADPALLGVAVDACQRILNVTPADHPDRATRLNNRGRALLARFGRTTGSLADLDAALEVLRAALDATPADHPDRRRYLPNLGIGWRTRFERTGAQAELDAAIDVSRAAVDATPADHPSRAAHLNNLGIALLARFGRAGRGRQPTSTRGSRSSGRRWTPLRPATPTWPAGSRTWGLRCGAGSSGPGRWPTWTRRSRPAGPHWTARPPLPPSGPATAAIWGPRC